MADYIDRKTWHHSRGKGSLTNECEEGDVSNRSAHSCTIPLFPADGTSLLPQSPPVVTSQLRQIVAWNPECQQLVRAHAEPVLLVHHAHIFYPAWLHSACCKALGGHSTQALLFRSTKMIFRKQRRAGKEGKGVCCQAQQA